MKKIISLFQRDYEQTANSGRKVHDAVVIGAEWVLNGEGYATRKWDGVAVLIQDGRTYMRFDLKTGRKKPEGFIPAQPNPDPVTGHWPGWVSADSPAGKWVREAVEKAGVVPDGTYEVCGPKIGTRHGTNPERLTEHILIPHGKDVLENCPHTFTDLMEYLKDKLIEGVVWYHPDGRMVKIKKADFPY